MKQITSKEITLPEALTGLTWRPNCTIQQMGLKVSHQRNAGPATDKVVKVSPGGSLAAKP